MNDLVETEAKVNDLNDQLEFSETERHISDEKLRKTKLHLKRTKSRGTYARDKLAKFQGNISFADHTDEAEVYTSDECINNYHELLKDKDKIISELQINVHYLESLFQDIKKSERIVTCYDEKLRRYNTQLKTCIYELLQHNVSVANVPLVIECG